MEYEKIVAAIEKAPLTWLPAILIKTVETVVAKKVFAAGGLERTIGKIIQKPEAVKSNSTDWLNAQCCMTCKHWADENEREKQVKAYQANQKCMDKKNGWPCAGDCNNTVANGIELYIDGNATANLEYDANFGCNNWDSI